MGYHLLKLRPILDPLAVMSAEFLVIADTGEDEVLTCDAANYAANVEAAQCIDSGQTHDYSMVDSYSLVETPGLKTIDDVADFLAIPTNQTIKSILVMDSNDHPILLCVRGDCTLNESKIGQLVPGFQFAKEADAERLMGCGFGFVGPVYESFDGQILLDYSLREYVSYVCGANKTDYHIKNVVLNRDIESAQWVDIRNAMAGDVCPVDPSQVLASQRGIEVGHVFKLGTKYSMSMNRQFTTSNGTLDYFQMGCYGIGVGRTIAAAIEQSNDDNGIIWPKALSPFTVTILNLAPKHDAVTALVEDVYTVLDSAGVDSIIDDRDESPGIKFKDADLIGFSYQIVIGKKSLDSQKIELKQRSNGEMQMVSVLNLTELIELI